MKNFTQKGWLEQLAQKYWTEVGESSNVDEMATTFNNLVMESLDEVAPYKTFTVKSHYKFGISEETKELMAKRDQTRMNIKTAGQNEKGALLIKYRYSKQRTRRYSTGTK